jgi:endonuclease III
MGNVKDTIKKLISTLGGKFSKEIGIDLSKGKSTEIFKWFLASKLFGARIGTNIAIKTYREFERCGVLSPEKILDTGWDGLVRILDDGGYARYDFSTATKLLEIMEDLKKYYDGDLNRLHQKARDEEELENLLKSLGKGIGDVTVNIFLRELRSVWKMANPVPSELVILAARNLGFISQTEEPLSALKKIWLAHTIKGKDFSDFEAALLRLGKDFCKKRKCNSCPMGEECRCKKAK